MKERIFGEISYYIRNHKKDNREKIISDAIKKFKCKPATARRLYHKIHVAPTVARIQIPAIGKERISNKITGIDESQLRGKYDMFYIVRNFVKTLKPGVFFIESEFINMCGIRKTTGYRVVLDSVEFEAYHGKNSGQIYWGHPKSIAKMKNEHVLN